MTPYRWADIAFIPDAALAAEIEAAWQWLVPGKWTTFLCSAIGGIFLEDQGGDIYWLESATAEIERIAADRAEFDQIMQTDSDRVWEIFLVPFVMDLREAGKIPGHGEYEVGNVCVVPAREALTLAADVHEQLSHLPDGARVRIRIVD